MGSDALAERDQEPTKRSPRLVPWSESDQFARPAGGTNRYDDELLAADGIGHRDAGLPQAKVCLGIGISNTATL